jgi:hypothetical protein
VNTRKIEQTTEEDVSDSESGSDYSDYEESEADDSQNNDSESDPDATERFMDEEQELQEAIKRSRRSSHQEKKAGGSAPRPSTSTKTLSDSENSDVPLSKQKGKKAMTEKGEIKSMEAELARKLGRRLTMVQKLLHIVICEICF